MAQLTVMAQAGGGMGGAMITTILPMLLIFVIFWFLLIRPQQKRMKEHQAKVDAVKKNDEVITGGGLMGKVSKVADDHVEIDLGGGLKVKAIKSTLSDVIPRGAAKPAND